MSGPDDERDDETPDMFPETLPVSPPLEETGPEPEGEPESEPDSIPQDAAPDSSSDDILKTAEPFHPAREPADEDEDAALPLPPPAPNPDEDEAEDEAPPPPPVPLPPVFAPEDARPPKPAVRGPGRVGRWLRRALVLAFIVLIAGPIAMTLVYRVVPPPLTWLMILRLGDGHGIDHRWRPLSRISPTLARAVIGAEDARFCEHHGFDFAAMQKAMTANARRPNRIRGGSTISQQTAKNVFLWPDRSYVRKGFEAWFTVLIETLWGKRRIMEVYLNSIEWGPGVYGAEAAAQRNFGVSAAALNPSQAARLAAILPRPLKWQADTPGAYVARRSRRIGAAEGAVDRDGLDGCLR
ncbi:MAG: monofunctional biosynthetic peptidoglycan transglycosylase [Caulobacter sp.]|nr:monofunctional biosynthetic peptidoglycan transglycosylase [Caulobacter sp.]